MIDDVLIVPLNSSHIQDVTGLEKECFSLPWSEQSIAEVLENNSSRFYVAVSNMKVQGYIGSNFILDEGYITNIAVTELARSNGLGGKLLENLISVAVKEKMAFLTLEVRASNQKAIRLYEKFGFADCGKRKNFYSKPTEDALIMTKML
ncbi:MAG: ribosomal protein S18-alanine N-acetyltransferase [Oscillospiraceae bacterium]